MTNKSKIKIYLCDITYDTIIHVSDTIPINIGYVGSYIKKKFGDRVEIELFKYPEDIFFRNSITLMLGLGDVRTISKIFRKTHNYNLLLHITNMKTM